MTDFITYAKAICVICAATFVLIWLVIGLSEALYSFIVALFSILVVAAIVAAAVTLFFLFFDWKNRK